MKKKKKYQQQLMIVVIYEVTGPLLRPSLKK